MIIYIGSCMLNFQSDALLSNTLLLSIVYFVCVDPNFLVCLTVEQGNRTIESHLVGISRLEYMSPPFLMESVPDVVTNGLIILPVLTDSFKSV